MATLTVRLPDDKHMRLKALAKRKHISINKLMEELSTQAIAEFDARLVFVQWQLGVMLKKASPFWISLTVRFRPNVWLTRPPEARQRFGRSGVAVC